ncbi:MAG TPA: hypothetical protein VJ963_07900 [Bacteroidales bacterium]|nr:hypothetical protein [Bacteroidales bacterium]
MFKLNWGENWFEEESIQVKIEIYEASEIEEKAKTKELSKPKNALDFTIDILDNVRVFRRAYIINEIAELNDALLVGICNIIGMNIRI